MRFAAGDQTGRDGAGPLPLSSVVSLHPEHTTRSAQLPPPDAIYAAATPSGESAAERTLPSAVRLPGSTPRMLVYQRTPCRRKSTLCEPLSCIEIGRPPSAGCQWTPPSVERKIPSPLSEA